LEEKIYGELVAAVFAYDRVKNEHAARNAKCMKLFQTMLGASSKAIIRSDFLAGCFRSAFLTLYMHYNSGIGGIQNSIDMLRLIQNIEWEPRKMDILEHIEKVDSMITLCSDLGHSIDEKSRCANIIASLQRAHAPQYVKDLEEAERQQHTLPWLIARLSRTASNLAMKGARKGERPMYDPASPTPNSPGKLSILQRREPSRT
jgi:hypothetical protein